jgi:hypothetical protein
MEDAKQTIVRQLETECTIRGVATDLAILAREQQQITEIPNKYQEFARLFNDKAADSVKTLLCLKILNVSTVYCEYKGQ